VTLDNCSVTVSEVATTAAPIPAELELQEPAPVPPEVVAEAPPTTMASTNEQTQQPAKSAAIPAKAAQAAGAATRKEVAAPAPRLAQMEEPPQKGSVPKPVVPYGLYALLVVGGVVGSSILSRLFSAVRSAQFSRPAVQNTPEVRQAALQALLLKESKKR
jgi:hypothetical protein